MSKTDIQSHRGIGNNSGRYTSIDVALGVSGNGNKRHNESDIINEFASSLGVPALNLLGLFIEHGLEVNTDLECFLFPNHILVYLESMNNNLITLESI
jgi:hypothetical protein